MNEHESSLVLNVIPNEDQAQASIIRRDMRGRIVWKISGNSSVQNERQGIRNIQAIFLESFPEFNETFPREDDGMIVGKKNEAAKQFILTHISDEKTFIYHAPLNQSEPAMREARRLGIETVVISGVAVTFVLNKEIIYSQDEGKMIPAAFTAQIDEDGWLTLDSAGDEEQEEGEENIVLTLNNIALELLSKQNQLEAKYHSDEHKREVKSAIDDWNRNIRGQLPRLSPESKNGDVLIAVKMENSTHFATLA